MIYSCFLLLGCANLVPWQTNLALADYYDATYASNAMEFAFPAVSTSVLLLTCSVLVCYGARLSFHLRLAVGTLCMAAALLLIPVVDLLLHLGVLSTEGGFAMTIVATSLTALCSASTQNALYALASLVGDTATQAVQTGNGIVGLIAVGLRVVTKVGLDPTTSVWLFILLAVASLLLSLFAYHAIVTADSIAPLLSTHEGRRNRRRVDSGPLEQAFVDQASAKRASPLGTLRHVSVEAGCVFLVFCVCLTCFPGLSTSTVSTTWRMGRYIRPDRYGESKMILTLPPMAVMSLFC